jgi:hypothetical protein
VRVSWLVGWVRTLLEDINRPRIAAIEQAQNAAHHNTAGRWGLHDQPDLEVPTAPRYALLNVRAQVEHFVLPLTSALRAPLWAYVPSEHRGKPDFFLSYTWNSLLLGPPQQEIGTLDAIEHLDQYAWIDFVAYNQHTIESIPTDMESVIGEIGKVVFAGTPVPTLGRIWCLWELLCANRTGTDFDIAIRPGFRNDKILAVNTLYRSFVGVETLPSVLSGPMTRGHNSGCARGFGSNSETGWRHHATRDLCAGGAVHPTSFPPSGCAQSMGTQKNADPIHVAQVFTADANSL